MHTLKLPLKTTAYDEGVLDKRFRLTCRAQNVVIRHAQKLLHALDNDKAYQACRDEYISLLKDGGPETEKRRDELSRLMGAARKEMGLTEAGLQSYGKVFQKAHKDHISSQIMQVVCTRVWKGVLGVLFGSGKALRFKKASEYSSIGCKSPVNGIRFYDDTHDYTPKSYKPVFRAGIEYLGLDIAIRKYEKRLSDPYAAESLCAEVSYCTLTREMFPSGWRYYIILTLDGPAPKKIPEEMLGHGVLGGDPGTSTFAAAGSDFAMLEELAPKCVTYNKEITRLQRAVDRSMRKMNPDNYNGDGSPKKGRRKWAVSENCRRSKRKVRALQRKKSAYVRDEHNRRANVIVCSCDTFINEGMDFEALARRAKKPAERSDKESTVTRKDGSTATVRKFRRKKRFGRSILDRAPSGQCAAIERKMKQYGRQYLETDTRTMKASQYDHVTDTCTPAALNERTKDIGGHTVQRDLYSAFVTGCADDTLSHPDRKKCMDLFGSFLKVHDELIAAMKADGKSRPACFGF